MDDLIYIYIYMFVILQFVTCVLGSFVLMRLNQMMAKVRLPQRNLKKVLTYLKSLLVYSLDVPDFFFLCKPLYLCSICIKHKTHP